MHQVFAWLLSPAKRTMPSRWCHCLLLRKSMFPMSWRLPPGQSKMCIRTNNRSLFSFLPANQKPTLSKLGSRKLHGMPSRNLPFHPQHLWISRPTVPYLRLCSISLQHLPERSQPAQWKMLQITMIIIYCTSYNSNVQLTLNLKWELINRSKSICRSRGRGTNSCHQRWIPRS